MAELNCCKMFIRECGIQIHMPIDKDVLPEYQPPQVTKIYDLNKGSGGSIGTECNNGSNDVKS